MKKIVILFSIILGLYSCEYYDGDSYDFSDTYPAYVELSDISLQNVPEGGSVKVTFPMREVVYKPFDVTWEITGDYTATGTIKVPKGASNYTTTISIPEGIVSDGSLDARFKLTGTSEGIALGRIDNTNLAFDIVINKFVAYNAADYTGTFTCNEPGYGDYPVNLSVDPEDNQKIWSDNFWDAGASVYYEFSGDFDQSIEMPEQEFTSGELYTVSGSGKYDGITKTFFVDYVVTDANGQLVDENTHTFTRQN